MNDFRKKIVYFIYRTLGRAHMVLTVRGVAAPYLIPFISALTIVFTFFYNNIQDVSRPMQVPMLIIAGIAIVLVPLKTIFDLYSRYILLRDYPHKVPYSHEHFEFLMNRMAVNDKYVESGYQIMTFREESGEKEYYVMSHKVNQKLWGLKKNENGEYGLGFNYHKRRGFFGIRIRDKYVVVNEIYDLKPFALNEAFEKNSQLFNQKKLRLCHDLYESELGKEDTRLLLQKTDYFNYICSNELAGYQIQSNYAIDTIFEGSRLILSTDRNRLAYTASLENKVIQGSGLSPVRNSPRINPVKAESVLTDTAVRSDKTRSNEDSLILYSLEDSPCSNHIGGSTLVITKDNYLLIGKQAGKAHVNANMYMPSGSGSFNYSDAKHTDDFIQVLINGMEREFKEEWNLVNKDVKIYTKVIGYARILGSGSRSRGAKPDFFGISYIDCSFDSIKKWSGKTRLFESGFSDSSDDVIIKVKPDNIIDDASICAKLNEFCNRKSSNEISVQLHIFAEILKDAQGKGAMLFAELSKEANENQ